jgi:hypothetical protein
MCKAYKKMAEAHKLMAEAYDELAGVEVKETKAIAKAEKKSANLETKENIKKEDSKEETQKEPEVDRVTVRTYLTEKSRSGKTQEVRNLIVAMGYEKLTDVPDEKLAELYQKAKVL